MIGINQLIRMTTTISSRAQKKSGIRRRFREHLFKLRIWERKSHETFLMFFCICDNYILYDDLQTKEITYWMIRTTGNLILILLSPKSLKIGPKKSTNKLVNV